MNKIIGISLLSLIGFASILPANAAPIRCSMFSSQAEAQAYFDAKKPHYHLLDRDNDGIACEALR